MYSISFYVIFQKAGLQALLKGTEDLSGLRGPLCSIVLIAYHTVVCYVLGKYSKFSQVLFSQNNSKLFYYYSEQTKFMGKFNATKLVTV